MPNTFIIGRHFYGTKERFVKVFQNSNGKKIIFYNLILLFEFSYNGSMVQLRTSVKLGKFT